MNPRNVSVRAARGAGRAGGGIPPMVHLTQTQVKMQNVNVKK